MAKNGGGNNESWEGLYWDSHKYNDRRKIKSGTYLHSFCPFCSKEITSENVLLLEIVTPDDVVGLLELSPYLNVFERKTNIHIPDGSELKDLRCPHCHASLKVAGKQCGLGDSSVASFLVGVSNTKVPFYVCMKIGCHWHAIDPEDQDKILLDGSDEW